MIESQYIYPYLTCLYKKYGCVKELTNARNRLVTAADPLNWWFLIFKPTQK
jgi:hypothetical protein